MLPLGTELLFLNKSFHSNEIQSLGRFKRRKGTLAHFHRNHRPFILTLSINWTELYRLSYTQGIEFIAINANDVEKYPADSPEKMINFKSKKI